MDQFKGAVLQDLSFIAAQYDPKKITPNIYYNSLAEWDRDKVYSALFVSYKDAYKGLMEKDIKRSRLEGFYNLASAIEYFYYKWMK